MFTKIINRTLKPIPWETGGKIPWNDPEFSRRMLYEHLTQEHDMASRRGPIIDQHVDWIDAVLLDGKPARILDLGCGPGLYTSRLAASGHQCTGIDFSPASIEYARGTAHTKGLNITYQLEDLLLADFGSGFELVMFIFGELNAFSSLEARRILQKAWYALEDNGALLLEVSTYESLERQGHNPPAWFSSQGGLFSARPHLCLSENFWDPVTHTATERYYIVDANDGSVSTLSACLQAYQPAEYQNLFQECGFEAVSFQENFGGAQLDPAFCLVTARKPSLAPHLR